MLQEEVSMPSSRTVNKKPIVIGTGLLALDVVIADDMNSDPMLCAGGTCGNVLIALAYLGWDAYPIARLRADAASKRVIDDLKKWKVKSRFITRSDTGSTPVVVQRIRQSDNGDRSHTFSRKCPECGSWLPWYKAVKAASVPDISPRLPKADVFYFDRTSRGAINLAKHARSSGSMVVFEPSAVSEPNLLADALAEAHVVKVASNRVRGNEEALQSKQPLLIVETLGDDGLRYSTLSRNTRRAWKTLPAFPVEDFRDSAGAGDWCTAGIISAVAKLGPSGLARASDKAIQNSLRYGQAMASWTCRYDGARGGMYVSSRADFDKAIGDIQKGKTKALKPRSISPSRKKTQTAWCECCA